MSYGNNRDYDYDCLKAYAEWNVYYHKLKWWQVFEKHLAKTQINWYYPLIRNLIETNKYANDHTKR